MGEIGQSESFSPHQWEKIGKVAKQVKWVELTIPSHSVPLLWEMIGKVVKQAKLAILSHLHSICI